MSSGFRLGKHKLGAPAHPDVAIVNPTAGQLLKWINNAWRNQFLALDELSDVEITTPSDGEVVTYEAATALWKNKPPAGGTHNLLSATHPDTLPASPVWGDILFANSDGKWARKPLGTAGYYLMVGVGEPIWSLPPAERLRLTADEYTTGTAFVNCNGLSFDAPANCRLLFQFFVIFRTAATTTGIALSVNCPTGYSICGYHTRIPTSTTAWTFGMQRAPNIGTPTTGIDLADTNTFAMVEGVLINGATAGVLCLSFASEVSGSEVRIRAGSGAVVFRMI